MERSSKYLLGSNDDLKSDFFEPDNSNIEFLMLGIAGYTGSTKIPIGLVDITLINVLSVDGGDLNNP